MNVIEMPNDETGYNLSVAEINCLGTLLPMCSKYRKKGKCTGNCDTCPWGEAQRAYGKLDDFQKAVVKVNAARHYTPDIPSVGDVVEGVIQVFMYVLGFACFAGSIWFIAFVAGKIMHG